MRIYEYIKLVKNKNLPSFVVANTFSGSTCKEEEDDEKNETDVVFVVVLSLSPRLFKIADAFELSNVGLVASKSPLLGPCTISITTIERGGEHPIYRKIFFSTELIDFKNIRKREIIFTFFHFNDVIFFFIFIFIYLFNFFTPQIGILSRSLH